MIHRLRGMLKKGDVKHEPIDMNELIASTLRLLHSELIDRRLSVSFDNAANLPATRGRPRAIAANIAQSFGECDGRDGKCAAGPTHHFDQHRSDRRRRGRGAHLRSWYRTASVAGARGISAVFHDKEARSRPRPFYLHVDRKASWRHAFASKQCERRRERSFSASAASGLR